LDTEIVYDSISSEWKKFFRLLEDEFGKVGIQKLTEEELQQEATFVFDELGYDEEGEELPDEQPLCIVTMNVATCLFPH
jgi:hypothetical protein